MSDTQTANSYSELYGYKIDNNPIASPGAQTFTAPYDAYLSSVNLYFKAKQSNDDGITMEIRNVINGLPGDKYYSRTSLQNDQINVDSTGNTPTKFTFTNPVFLQGNKQYAIVLYTASTNYQLAISVMGEYDQNATTNVTTEGINSNQEVHGTYCYSMDGKTWNTGDPSSRLENAANGTICLKFDVNTVKFNTDENTDLIEFTSHTPYQTDLSIKRYSARNTDQNMSNISYLTFLPSVFTPNNTSVNWTYNFDDGNPKEAKPLTKDSTIPVNNSIGTIYVWAKLNGSQNVSPVINAGSMNLTAQTTNVDGNAQVDQTTGIVGPIDQNGNTEYALNPFSKYDHKGQIDDGHNAGEYISRNINFQQQDESQDPTFTDVFASYEFQANGAPRPDVYFNLNADNDPKNRFNPIWIQMTGYDEIDPSNSNNYVIVDPYNPDTEVINAYDGTPNTEAADNLNRRTYSQNITDDPYHPETNWVRYHFHVSLNRLAHKYLAYFWKNSDVDTQNYTGNIYAPQVDHDDKAYEIEFKLIFHSDSIYHHPKVRKFRATMNDSDNDDLSEVAPS